MTVTTELSRSTFPWTGAETAFACNWPADKSADVKVFFRTATGVTSEMTGGVNHDVTLANETKLVTVLPIALPPAPGTLIVTRETPALVSETLQDGEGFSLNIIQQLHDRAAMRSAEDRTRFARAIVLDEGAELGSGNFDLGGSGLSNLAPGVAPTDAATVGQMLALIIASGNVPVPLLADVGKAIVALADGSFGWGQLDKAALVDGILSADAGGRAKLADGFFAADAASLAKFANGFLAASAAGRAKMAAKFLLASHVSDDPTELAALRTLLSVAMAQPGDVVISWTRTAPAGTMKANGAAPSRAIYAALDAAIYCGDADNPTADWGFRCNDPLNPTTSRSTTGAYIVLPDARGEFLRGWDDARGVDIGRSFWARQAEAFKAHNHPVSDPGHVHPLAGGPNANGSGTVAPGAQSGNTAVIGGMSGATTGITIQNTGGTETRPRNLSPLICIRH